MVWVLISVLELSLFRIVDMLIDRCRVTLVFETGSYHDYLYTTDLVSLDEEQPWSLSKNTAGSKSLKPSTKMLVLRSLIAMITISNIFEITDLFPELAGKELNSARLVLIKRLSLNAPKANAEKARTGKILTKIKEWRSCAEKACKLPVEEHVMKLYQATTTTLKKSAAQLTWIA